jgi:hypothetical protein
MPNFAKKCPILTNSIANKLQIKSMNYGICKILLGQEKQKARRYISAQTHGHPQEAVPHSAGYFHSRRKLD